MQDFAFVFPGQGSQSVGMLNDWNDHPAALRTLQEASDALGQDVADLITNGSKEDLDLTINTQPVMLTVGIAAWRVWQEEVNFAPKVLAGHSLGEYSALVAAESLSLTDAIRLVRFRAQVMQEAVPQGLGAMAAILGLAPGQVKQACIELTAKLGEGGVVEAVNFNDRSQTVIAGSRAAVDLACVKLKELGAKRALLLPVSAPFHSSLMRTAAILLLEKLKQTIFLAPKIPVINNVDVRMESEPEVMVDALYRQAFHPVRWVEILESMKALSIKKIVECGPGKVLAGLCKRVDVELQGLPMYDLTTLAAVKESIQNEQ